MTYRCFDVSVRDHVGHIVLCRGDELNTMVPEFWRELPEIVDGLSADGSVRALVVSSTGRHFSAGMDLSVFGGISGGADAEPGRRQARTRELVLRLQESFTCLERARIPVIAAVQGGCVGGALDLVAACDLRYCSTDAFFVIEEINIGMTADVGSLQRLPKILPDAIVRELAFTGRGMPAARAREVGLVNDVCSDHDTLVKTALATAAEIAAKSPLAVWGTKVAINYARDHSVADGLEQIATWQAGMFQAADLTEAVTARADKREAAYDDLLATPDGL